MIYLDNAATTLPMEEYLSEYENLSKEYFANSSSIHKLGLFSSRLLETARKDILSAFKTTNHNVVFTSGATEAINLALKGFALAHLNRGKHIVTTCVEHPAVLETINQLYKLFNFDVTVLPVDETGCISLNLLRESMRSDTILVSIMAVNNEVGAINNIKEIINIVKAFPKAVLHVDATQAIGKVDLPYKDIDMFSYSGHKICGLKGSGALIYKKNITLEPVITGGGHESGLRSGTVDVALAKVLSSATKNAVKNVNNMINYVKPFYDELYSFFSKREDIHMNSPVNGSPFIINISPNKKASVVVEALSNKDIMVSSLSACHSKREAKSYVVKAMFNNDIYASNTLRVSFGANNKMEDIISFENAFDEIMKSIR